MLSLSPHQSVVSLAVFDKYLISQPLFDPLVSNKKLNAESLPNESCLLRSTSFGCFEAGFHYVEQAGTHRDSAAPAPPFWAEWWN